MWQAYLFRGICQHYGMYVCQFPGHIVNYSEFVLSIYTDTVVLFVHMKELAYMAFEGQIILKYIYCSNVK